MKNPFKKRSTTMQVDMNEMLAVSAAPSPLEGLDFSEGTATVAYKLMETSSDFAELSARLRAAAVNDGRLDLVANIVDSYIK
jgi:hypothetical protein